MSNSVYTDVSKANGTRKAYSPNLFLRYTHYTQELVYASESHEPLLFVVDYRLHLNNGSQVPVGYLVTKSTLLFSTSGASNHGMV